MRYKLGEFFITALPVPHGVECYSYIIEHDSFGKLLFCTDLSDFPYRVKDVNTLMCEINNDIDVMIKNACNNEFSMSSSNTHLSLDKAIDIIKRHQSVKLQDVIGIHLSDINSDENLFSKRIKEETGIDVLFAKKGANFELNYSEF